LLNDCELENELALDMIKKNWKEGMAPAGRCFLREKKKKR